MRARLIYNPISGQELMKRAIADVLDHLEGFGYETSAFATTADENSAKEEAMRVCQSGDYDLIVAAGGDGTINAVVNGMVGFSHLTKLAIIPMGTTNDFARALKIPRNEPLAAIDIVGKKQLLAVDVGRMTRETDDEKTYFINIAATGALSELTYSVPSNLKTTFGYLAYLAKGVELLPRVKKVPVRIEHDNGVFEGEASMIFVALTNSVGGFERIAPDAKLDDGLFSVFLVKTDNLFEILALLAMVAQGTGKHLIDVNTEYIRSRSLTIEPLSTTQMLVNLDGEYGGEAPVKFDNLKGAIDIFVNLDEIDDDNYIGDDEDAANASVAQKFAEEVTKIEGTQH
ncbi:MAG: diacylglycerol kinase family lipid kinase [Streptococcaceae bacterium]|nr:diacylglycerol kinase family lipid kinase [Streptococcaceae bacterium]